MTRKEQKEIRRQQIIQAALDLFLEHGYYGTKTSQISRRAGSFSGYDPVQPQDGGSRAAGQKYP